jgi:hypothetical protein
MPNARNAKGAGACRCITGCETKNVRVVAAVGESMRSREGQLTKDDVSAERQALEHAKSALIESAAAEVVSIGRALFKDGEPSDTELQRRYRLYKRLEAALALPAGLQRLEAQYKAYRELRAN